MSTYTIVISDIVRRERHSPVGEVELYTTPMLGARYERRGVIVRITANSVAVMVEPKDGESYAQRAELAARLTVDRDLVLAVRLMVIS